MPTLTQISETKKGRYALFFDGEFAFSLDAGTFADADLHQDDELEPWQIEELRKKSDTRRALDKAMDFLALRDHAAGELYDKLCRKFDPHSAAAAVVEALGDEEEDPDLASARALVQRQYASRLAQGKEPQVAAALARRGFSHAVIRTVLAEARDE